MASYPFNQTVPPSWSKQKKRNILLFVGENGLFSYIEVREKEKHQEVHTFNTVKINFVVIGRKNNREMVKVLC